MALADRQLKVLNRLLREILPANRFYAGQLGNSLTVISLDEFVERVPFTTKEELAADHEGDPPYGTTFTHPAERYNRYHQTSGTRGEPLAWLDDPDGWEWVLENWRWVWTEAGAAAGQSAFFPFSFGPFLGFWAGFEAAASMGIRAIPGGGMSSEDRLRLMARLRPEWICCTPTYALRLAEVGEAIGLRVSDLGTARMIVCGEPGGSIPAVRARIAAAWNAVVIDHHGMTEIGPVTVGDLEQPELLKIRHDAYFAEVVDPESGEPVTMGEVGELVLTTLGRAGSPLLRYRTGDLVKPVACGEAFALDGGIIGRADDMVVVRGVNLYPSGIDAVVRTCDGIGEYEVEVDQREALPEVRVRVETGEAVAQELEGKLRTAFGMRIPVEAVDRGSLPVFEVKAKRWRVTT
ncbi:MAG: AMP-binding protein [Akkermansiaceae bacterium]|nr:AMP-binding protein [Akkermansiaceae bacterium]NNM27918.1 AMP-binding protein [Akkermansiaceae bacterium]